MSWIEFLPTLVIAVFVVMLPGVPIVLLLRLGSVLSILLTPVAGLTVLALATMLAHVLPMEWSIVHLAIAGAALSGVALILRRRGTAPRASRRAVLPVVVLLGAGVIIAVRIATIVGDPSAISQTYDNVFHLNAVAYILSSGDASPLRISTLSHDVDGLGGFYPALWHAVVALVAQLGGSSIPSATTAVAIVVCSLVWPSSVLLLTRSLLGSGRLVTVISGAASAGFYAMPYLLIDWGVLYPTLLSYAAVPVALAAVVWLARPRVGEAPGILTSSTILLGSIAVVGLAHPSGIGAVILLVLPIALPALVRAVIGRSRRGDGRGATVLSICGLGALLAGAAALTILRPSIFASEWPPTAGYVDAVRFAITMGGMVRPVDFAATGLLLAGVVTVLVLRRNRSLIVLWMIPVGLQAAALSLPLGTLRYAMTGTWYTDDNRISSLVVLGAIPLMVEGARGLVMVGARTLASMGARPGRGLQLVGSLIALSVVLAATQLGPPLRLQMQYADDRYAETDESEILTVDERALLERVPEVVPEDAIVLGNPWTGASLVSAIGDRRTLVGAIGQSASLRAIVAIEAAATGEAEECAAVAALADEVFALDFGEDGAQGRPQPDPGLERSERFVLIDREGDAALYALVDCDDEAEQ